ncbi:MAG: hypothetical protein OEY14_13020 [Myxococcales bacterium]|nr:hypothetical protein [Myxococcales bacterium]
MTKKNTSKARKGASGRSAPREPTVERSSASSKAPKRPKAAPKKAAPKKAAVKKAEPKKAAAKKAAPKKAAAKKAEPKKAEPKKAAAKKAEPKKAEPKKAEPKKEASQEEPDRSELEETPLELDEGDDSPPAEGAEPRASRGASALAAQILAAEDPSARIAEQGGLMLGANKGVATRAARVVGELLIQSPQSVVPLIDKLVSGLTSPNRRVVQASAEALPQLARVSPARVARHLERLRGSFDQASDVGKDGLVRTFAALCVASVAYQKRLEPILMHALAQADGRTLVAWTETVLPALKGEPHANARAVVEERLYRIPRSVAQKIADFLNIRLRASYRA